MPYKNEYEKQQIPRHLDRRVKLSLEQREEIKNIYGKISQRKLAKLFDVSRSTIVFIGNPEAHKRNLQRRAERGGSKQYYNKEDQVRQARSTRAYRKQLDSEGLLASSK